MLITGKLYKHLVFRRDGKPDAFFVYYGVNEYKLQAEEVFLCMSYQERKGVVICKILTSTGFVGDLYYATPYHSKFVLAKQG